MKISTKGRYGLRVMADLSASYMKENTACIPLRDVAVRQDLSEKYLEHIISPLVKAGLVKSIRGAQGGYMLGRAPQDITVGEVLRHLEGPLTFAICAEDSADCSKSGSCAAQYVWRQMKDAIEAVVDNITLADLADKTCK